MNAAPRASTPAAAFLPLPPAGFRGGQPPAPQHAFGGSFGSCPPLKHRGDDASPEAQRTGERERPRLFALALLAALLLPLAATIAQAAGLLFLAQGLNAPPARSSAAWAAPTSARLAGGAALIFAAGDSAHGRELWQTDGTAAGTRLVADIYPGPGGSNPSDLTPFNGRVYFAANDGAHGTELWRSDGTTAGTRLVADINPAAAGAAISNLTVVGARLFFTANDGAHGNELWVFDGASASLVKDIHAGGSGSGAARLTNFNGHLLFAADDGLHGVQWWQSDGRAVDTRMLPVIDAAGPNLAWLAAPAAAAQRSAGPPLAPRDAFGRGPAAAAAAVAALAARNISPGLGDNPLWLTAAGNSLFYLAGAGTRGWGVWDRAAWLAAAPLMSSPPDPHSAWLNNPSHSTRLARFARAGQPGAALPAGHARPAARLARAKPGALAPGLAAWPAAAAGWPCAPCGAGHSRVLSDEDPPPNRPPQLLVQS